MMLKIRLIFISLATLLLLFTCDRRFFNVTKITPQTTSVIPPNAVVIEGHNLTTNVGTVYVPNTATVTASNGKLNIKVKKFGVSYNPGIGAMFHRDKLLLSLDLRLVYLHRFNLNAGFGINPNGSDKLIPFVALSYALPYKMFDNTCIFGGITLNKDLVLGVRLSF